MHNAAKVSQGFCLSAILLSDSPFRSLTAAASEVATSGLHEGLKLFFLSCDQPIHPLPRTKTLSLVFSKPQTLHFALIYDYVTIQN